MKAFNEDRHYDNLLNNYLASFEAEILECKDCGARFSEDDCSCSQDSDECYCPTCNGVMESIKYEDREDYDYDNERDFKKERELL